MLTIVALMMANFLSAVDITIVETAMPRIVGALGGFSLFTWVVTGYMLTSTATVPVYGKLCDLIGRKRTFTIGALIFISGSALCGLAQSMEQLIFFRCLQGLGAGALIPTVHTIAGDLFSPAERAKVQGWFSAVWGFAGLIGPLLGGLLVDYATWRWLFYINLPIGLLALWMVHRFFDEEVETKSVQVDYLGSVTLTFGLISFLYALLTGAEAGWGSSQIVVALVIAAMMLGTFFWQERRAPDPVVPLKLFRIRTISAVLLVSFLMGGMFYGFTVYLPIWAQGVQGFSATRSGASLLWLSLGWPLASIVSGRVIVRLGIRPSVLIGTGINIVAATMLVLFGRLLDPIPEGLLALLTFSLGCGMGFTTISLVLGVQSAVGWKQRGIATALVQFLRTLGGLIWVSVMGATMNISLFQGLATIPGLVVESVSQAGELANSLLDPRLWSALPVEHLVLMRQALAGALRNVHVIVLGLAAAAFCMAVAFPNTKFAASPAPTEAEGTPD